MKVLYKPIDENTLTAFRQCFCKVYCGKKETDKCPESCRIKTLNKHTMTTFRIRDVLEV